MTTLTNQNNLFKFKDINDQEIKVKINIQDKDLFFYTELYTKKYKSNYSIETIKKDNQIFFLCKSINDVYDQIEALAKDNKSTFIEENNTIHLFIPTNIPLAPEIKVELLCIEDNNNISKVEDINNNNNININYQNENNINLLIQENREIKQLINRTFKILMDENNQLKAKINLLENILINNNMFYLGDDTFKKIKYFISGDSDNIRYNIKFNLIYKLEPFEQNWYRYSSACDINAPALFIFVTTQNSIFGAYASYFNTHESWAKDPNAFIFSINLNKKYMPMKSKDHYKREKYGFNFKDITFNDLNYNVGLFYTGHYLKDFEIEGKKKQFNIRHFLVYQVDIKQLDQKPVTTNL